MILKKHKNQMLILKILNETHQIPINQQKKKDLHKRAETRSGRDILKQKNISK